LAIAYYVVVGALLAAAGLIAACEIVAPASVMRWRWKVVGKYRGSPADVRDGFDRLLGTGGPDAWKDPQARPNLRLFGVGMLIFTLVGDYLLLVWVPRALRL
jgi:hypothetical protein